MTADGYRYEFGADIDLDDVESALILTAFAVESLHGSQGYLDYEGFFDREERVLEVGAHTASQRDFCRILLGFLRAEFGDDAFGVERVPEPNAA